jgi:hypothetical protein
VAHNCEYEMDLQVLLCYLTIDAGTCNCIVPVIIKAPRHGDLWGSGCVTPCVLNLVTRWGDVGYIAVNVQFLQFTP